MTACSSSSSSAKLRSFFGFGFVDWGGGGFRVVEGVALALVSVLLVLASVFSSSTSPRRRKFLDLEELLIIEIGRAHV